MEKKISVYMITFTLFLMFELFTEGIEIEQSFEDLCEYCLDSHSQDYSFDYYDDYDFIDCKKADRNFVGYKGKNQFVFLFLKIKMTI